MRRLLLALPPLVACAPSALERAAAPSRSPAPPSLETVVLQDFAYMGPGSMGRFVDYALHPSLDGVLFAVADVGGVYLSADDGASWSNICRDLPTNGVWAIGLVVLGEGVDETTRVVLGTDSGLFASDAVPSGEGLDPDDFAGWTQSEGLDFGDERPSQDMMRALGMLNLNYKTMPIGAVAVSPSDPEVVYAAITSTGQMNLAQDPKDPYSLQHFDRWKVFRSNDGGLSFEPVLRFSEPIERFVVPGYDSDGSVFTLLVHPDDPGRVWVASDRGLYASSNADTTEDADGDGSPDITWAEIGTPERRESTDLGLSWTETAAACEPWAEGSTASGWCLPIVEEATVQLVLDPETGWPSPGYETHPNTRAVSLSEVAGAERLYVTVWDRGHAFDQHPNCDEREVGNSFNDEELEYLRGGVYASDDNGETWRWLLTDTGTPGTDPAATPLITILRYRCDAETSERNSDSDTIYFPEVKSAPTTDQDLLLVGALSSKSGLWRYDAREDEPWAWLTDPSDEGYDARFEGERPANLSRGRKIETSRLAIDWEQTVDGWPQLYFGARGVLRGTWDAASETYHFEHLGSAYAGTIDDLSAWSGTGLDDAVVWDVQAAGGYLWVGVSDGALLRAERLDGAWTYIPVGSETWTSNWSDEPTDFRKDETHAIAYEAESGVLYATNVATASDYLYSVFAFDGEAWRVVGGYGWPTDEGAAELVDAEHMNGLYSGSPLARVDFNDLLALPASAGFDLDLLAATSDGLWAYDAALPEGEQWWQLCPALTDGLSFAEVVADLDRAPGFAFAAGDGRRLGGLLAIDLTDQSCASIRITSVTDALTGQVETQHDPIGGPTALALADGLDGTPRLVVGASEDGYATLFSGALDCSGTCVVDSWTRAWTVAGQYADEDPRAPVLERFDVTAIAVDPNHPWIVLASLGTSPGWDFYNPQWVLVSEDGGQSATAVDFEADDHGLPNRSMHQLEFSDDGLTLFAGTRSSLFAMPVGW